MTTSSCSYCHPENEFVLWRDEQCRVLLVEQTDFTGWCRVVWNQHLAELSDLDEQQRHRMMQVVAEVEHNIRELMAPKKINLASLGTGLPHLHWHIIPRNEDDSHFPEPVWCQPLRPGVVRPLAKNFVDEMKKRLSAAL
ncbi:HIT domain [Pragia fontium]|uniref:HIT family protein n=1 Tax=Pragia fontium TaxID=82985 RepID=UPI000E01C379|nr:HIT family protein [Pragia fontium]SUB81490.1 HIT domain [Pragia fontium]